MRFSTAQRLRRTGLGVFAAVFCASAAQADTDLAARMGSLLAAERDVLEVMPEARLAALTVAVTAAAPDPAATDPAGPDTTAPTPAAAAPATAPTGDAQWRCLTEALYFEARGESQRGMFAVAEVILNRVESANYPGTICSVVQQGTGRLYACQFTYTCDGLSDAIGDQAAWVTVGRVARAILDGAPRTLTAGATHYHTRAVSPSWARRFPQTAAIGAHLFYREPNRIALN